ncbi:MAG: bifunctional (p)ppGpp synthetase/guanosine-3',5'-bis(diphosphate) 3'-pyrophosphohydrolase [Muribaculaceae bacterium]|nr:bifunctional (p)ppGpp synthetase/guanosine-3',5'-bis(diphosphate) 3'-pyrophosphohydrolase [Muribaculaceae bacterium]
MENDYQAIIDENINELFANIRPRMSDEDMERIGKAFNFACEAHSKQRRKSGEPYIIHPIAVARIIAEELELSTDAIIAAFLHDVVEDTDYTIEDIRLLFGSGVAFLVNVVTKQKKEEYEHSKQIDNYQQMLSSVQYDIRALLIKLADRLHNMRTLSSMRPDKQMKIAGETDYFYAPLANRLGLYHIKTELENLSFQYRCPLQYAHLEELLNAERLKVEDNIQHFIEMINETLSLHGIKVRTEIRYRKPYSIWRKMQSKGCDFQHVNGKYYIRIIYPNETIESEKNTTLRIYSALTDTFKEAPGSVANYINAPKENGYQSFHVKLLSEQGTWEEIHISSERMVRNSRLGCAAERTEANVDSWLSKFRSVLKDIKHHTHEIEYMDGITSSFYNDDITVYTPKGKSIVLPKNATALDFAFEIHSRIGEHAQYARINGKLTSIKTTLRRGDVIEIGTNDNVLPQPDWLCCVSTYKAKRSLRIYFANRRLLEYNRCKYCHPIPGEEVIGFKEHDDIVTLHKRNCPTAIRQAAHYGDSIVPVDFKEDPEFLYPVRIRVRGVDRYHLLSDLIVSITDELHLSMKELSTETVDHIAACTIDFAVHSVDELQRAMENIATIDGIDEVSRIDIE